MSKVDYTGQRIGQCVVLGLVIKRPGHYQRMWRLLCDCGNECEKPQQQLKRPGKFTRCAACYARAAGDASRVHGESKGYLFRAWDNMRRRCYDPGSSNYKCWGGRGISVFATWREDYVAFAAWIRQNIGERPTPHYSLDRIHNDKDYEPGNLRWASPKMQANNRRPWAADAPSRLRAAALAAQVAIGPRRPVGRPRKDRGTGV